MFTLAYALQLLGFFIIGLLIGRMFVLEARNDASWARLIGLAVLYLIALIAITIKI